MLFRRYLLPFCFPLTVLLIGSWRLSVSREPSQLDQSTSSQLQQSPDYSQPPPGTHTTCRQDPSIGDDLLQEGRRLGITVTMGEPELPGKDASYRALPGRLGTITLKQRPMSEEVRCLLISHEFIHVLQHLHGDLKGVPTLGWTTDHPDVIPQEAEAYGHQNRAGYVLKLLRTTVIPEQAAENQ